MSTFFVHVRTWECIRSGVLGKERNPVKHVKYGIVRGQKELKISKFTEVKYIYLAQNRLEISRRVFELLYRLSIVLPLTESFSDLKSVPSVW